MPGVKNRQPLLSSKLAIHQLDKKGDEFLAQRPLSKVSRRQICDTASRAACGTRFCGKVGYGLTALLFCIGQIGPSTAGNSKKFRVAKKEEDGRRQLYYLTEHVLNGSCLCVWWS